LWVLSIFIFYVSEHMQFKRHHNKRKGLFKVLSNFSKYTKEMFLVLP